MSTNKSELKEAKDMRFTLLFVKDNILCADPISGDILHEEIFQRFGLLLASDDFSHMPVGKVTMFIKRYNFAMVRES